MGRRLSRDLEKVTLNIKYAAPIGTPINVKVFNLQGQLVYDEVCIVAEQACCVEKILAGGVYIVRVTDNEKVFNTKLQVLSN
jgi:hypothetical protein